MLPKIGVTLTAQETSPLRGKPQLMLKRVLQAWLPLPDALIGMVVNHLPSPVVAQRVSQSQSI